MNTEIEFESKTNSCRYCFEHDNLISPCSCSGTTKYVHKKCLFTWIVQKAGNNIVPNYFLTNDIKCEICNFKLNITENYIQNRFNFFKFFSDIYYLVTIYAISFVLIGLISSTIPILNNILGYFNNLELSWRLIFLNGFFYTHIFIAFLYIAILYKNYYVWKENIFKEFNIIFSLFFILSGFILWPFYLIYSKNIRESKKSGKLIIDILEN